MKNQNEKAAQAQLDEVTIIHRLLDLKIMCSQLKQTLEGLNLTEPLDLNDITKRMDRHISQAETLSRIAQQIKTLTNAGGK